MPEHPPHPGSAALNAHLPPCPPHSWEEGGEPWEWGCRKGRQPSPQGTALTHQASPVGGSLSLSSLQAQPCLPCLQTGREEGRRQAAMMCCPHRPRWGRVPRVCPLSVFYAEREDARRGEGSLCVKARSAVDAEGITAITMALCTRCQKPSSNAGT